MGGVSLCVNDWWEVLGMRDIALEDPDGCRITIGHQKKVRWCYGPHRSLHPPRELR
jgi:hypothetical protein